MSYVSSLSEIKPDIDVFYKTVGNLKLPLQVYLPDKFDEKKKYKMVIAIHGGAWHSFKETPSDWDGGWMANYVKYYSKKGYVGIVFSYRDINFDSESDVGDILNDCRDALKYVVDKFTFADTDNVLLAGDSAGGHLAICLAMNLLDGITPAIKINKVAAYNPITDCTCEKWSYCAANAVKYSPTHNIKLIDSEVLVMHGTADLVVDIEDSRKFVTKMKTVGNNIRMIEIPDAGHAFILFGFKAEEKEVLRALEITDKHFNL